MTTTHRAPAPLTPRWISRALSPSPDGNVRRTFWAVFLTLFAVSALWGVSNPLMASVDEPAHVVKAAATVRGASDTSTDGAATGIGQVELPQVYAQLALFPNCFAFNPEASADCQASVTEAADEVAVVETSAMNYNPLYYYVVGWPALLPAGEHTVYLMRLMNALVASALVGLAAGVLTGLTSRRWLGLALLLPFTPTMINLFGSVNPQSFEVAGAFLLWVSLLALIRSPDPSRTTTRLVLTVIATVPLANARSLGPLMALAIVVLCVLSAPMGRTLDVLRTRRGAVAAGLCVLVCAVSTFWTLTNDALPEGAGATVTPVREIVTHTLGLTSAYTQQMFFALGWLDVPAPLWSIMLMAACVGLIVLLGWSLGTTRDRLVIALAAGAVFALPLVSHVVQAQKIGYFWQGRYAFPLVIGIVLLAGFAIERRTSAVPDWLSTNVVTTVALTFAGLHVVSFYGNLHRYAVGASGTWILDAPLSWTPVPAVLLTAGYALAWFGLVVAVVRATNPRPAQPVAATVELLAPGR